MLTRLEGEPDWPGTNWLDNGSFGPQIAMIEGKDGMFLDVVASLLLTSVSN